MNLKSNHTSIIQVADLQLNTIQKSVKRGTIPIPLTAQEYKLLHYLMRHSGEILTRDMILSQIWQYANDVETRVVDVYIGYLRKKIDYGYRQKLIHSIRGFGYLIKE